MNSFQAIPYAISEFYSYNSVLIDVASSEIPWGNKHLNKI